MQDKAKQRALDSRYLRMAAIWAENSYCQRRKVGAIIVKHDMIISDGFNGTPSGFENVCEDESGFTKPYVLHAEANAITKVARSNNSSDGATLYITASPCMECSKLTYSGRYSKSGISRAIPYHRRNRFARAGRCGMCAYAGFERYNCKMNNLKRASVWIPLIVAIAFIVGFLAGDIVNRQSGPTPTRKKISDHSESYP